MTIEKDLDETLNSIPDFGTPYMQTEVCGAESGAAISMWRPIHGEGPTVFKSQVMMQTTMGTVTVRFEINVDTLGEAISVWKEAATEAAKEYNSQLANQQLSDLAPAAFPTVQ